MAEYFPLSSAVMLPIIQAINERMRAIGRIQISENILGPKNALKGKYGIPVRTSGGVISNYAPEVRNAVQTGHVLTIGGAGGTITTDCFATSSSGPYRSATVGDPSWTPAVGDACNVVSNYTGSSDTAFPLTWRWPLNSYKALQSIIENLACLFFTTNLTDRSGTDALVSGNISFNGPVAVAYPVSPTNPAFDYTSFPDGGGWTRYRTPEISSLGFSTTYANGDRALFVWNNGGTTFDNVQQFYAGFSLPTSTTAEKQYSGRIMKRVSGAWVVDTDQVTPIPRRSINGDFWQSGDLANKACADQLLSAIKSLTGLVYFQPLHDYRYRPGSNIYSSSDNTTIGSCTNSKTLAESNWNASTETAATSETPFGSSIGSPQHGQEYMVGNVSGGQWVARIRTVRTRLNAAGFQSYGGLSGPGATATPLNHTFSSALDFYYATRAGLPGESSLNVRTYAPPVAGMTDSKWKLVQAIAAANTDVRTSNWIGDNTVLPSAPACVSGQNTVTSWFEIGSVVVQKFNVAGGFTYV